MTFIYEPGPYFLKTYRMRKKWTSYVKAFKSYRLTRHTDRQTDALKICTRRFAGGQEFPNWIWLRNSTNTKHSIATNANTHMQCYTVHWSPTTDKQLLFVARCLQQMKQSVVHVLYSWQKYDTGLDRRADSDYVKQTSAVNKHPCRFCRSCSYRVAWKYGTGKWRDQVRVIQ